MKKKFKTEFISSNPYPWVKLSQPLGGDPKFYQGIGQNDLFRNNPDWT